MAYIGKQPLVGNYISCDALSASATTTYNLTSNGTAVYPTVPQNCLVSLNGVVQAPVTSYTISGATIIFSTTLSTTDTIDYVTVLGSTLNIGTPSNNTVGLSQFSATGTPSSTTFLRGDNSWATPAADIAWQSVQTTNFTAVAARAYPVNTTSAAITVTLPASPAAGDQIILVDYAGTWDTNNLTINPNSNKIVGQTSNVVASKDREAITLTYIDATQGWLPSSGYQEGTTGISIPYSIDFLVVAGGASGGADDGGGGGAGGYRLSTQSVTIGTVITVTVGDGGASVGQGNKGNNGSNSSISGSGLTTITSAGGGGGGRRSGSGSDISGNNGGSGGGNSQGASGETAPVGQGNTPSTSPSQGNNGGVGGSVGGSGGGGGAGAVGGDNSGSQGGNGGNGTASSITGSSVTRAGGGGGGSRSGQPQSTGGSGGGGAGGVSPANGTAGTANTGGGGGGASYPTGNSGAGGKGVVILSMPTASYSGTTTGSPTVTTSGSNTILQFNGNGSYTA